MSDFHDSLPPSFLSLSTNSSKSPNFLSPSPQPYLVFSDLVLNVISTGLLKYYFHLQATMERDLLMKPPLPNLAPTPTPKLTPGMDTTATATDHTGKRGFYFFSFFY